MATTKALALVSTLALTAMAMANPSLAQTSSRNRPADSGTALPQAPYEADRGNVISVTPIVQAVAVPQRVCHDEAVAVQRQPSGAGALIGAIAGGAMGNAIGAGAGRAAATAIGVIGGAAVGDHIESGGQGAQERMVRRCTTQSAYEDRTVAYSVVYEYAGRQYTTQMRQDPGRYVQVQVQAVADGEAAAPTYAPPARTRSALPPPSSRPAPVYVERPVYAERPMAPAYAEPVYQSYPAAPVYYESPYPSFGAGLAVGALIGYGIHRGYSGHPYRGWRGR